MNGEDCSSFLLQEEVQVILEKRGRDDNETEYEVAAFKLGSTKNNCLNNDQTVIGSIWDSFGGW